jgi:hypothetical protein
LLQAPGGDRHFPRPLSPRRLRGKSHRSASSALTHHHSSDTLGERGSSDEGRNVRRRISIATLPQAPPPHPSTQQSGPPYHPQQQYQAHGYSQPHAPLPLVSLPPLHSSTNATPEGSNSGEADTAANSRPAAPSHGGRGLLPAPQPSSHLLQAPPHAGPWNPYAAERRSVSGPGPTRDGR